MNRKIFLTSTSILLLMFSYVSANSEPVKNPNVDETTAKRQGAMRELNQRIKKLDELIKQQPEESDFQTQVSEHAKVMEAIAEQIPSLFPQNSLNRGSRAKPEIWEKRPEFEKAATELQTKVRTFIQTVNKETKAEEIIGTYKKLEIAKTCELCHGTFRKEKKESDSSEVK